MRLPELLQPQPVNHSFVLGLNEDGKVVHNLQYQANEAYSPITSVKQYNDILYFGDDKKALREQMQEEMGKPESAIGLYHDGQKGLRSYLMADPYTSYQAFVKTQ